MINLSKSTVNPEGFVFERNPETGALVFKGDFEGLYQAKQDPWGQSCETDPNMAAYYQASRARLLEVIRRRCAGSLGRVALEVGCGHGHVTALLNGTTTDLHWVGMDISLAAVERAAFLHPSSSFYQGDITQTLDPTWGNMWQVVVLNQVLWYIMHRFSTVVDNCYKLLGEEGLLVVSQAFLHNQQYGREYIDGFSGLIGEFRKDLNRFELIEARLEDRSGLVHNDGILVFRKK
jgi:SAM-dependent methyltransferase